MIKEFVAQVDQGEIDAFENLQKTLKEVEQIDSEYHYLNAFSDWLALAQVKHNVKGKLHGVAVSVKDAVCVKGVESRAGSAILNSYKPVFDATVIEKVVAAGGLIIGKTSQDEFGFGSFNTNVGNGLEIPKNPFDKARSCGGSSGGCAGMTQKLSSPHVSIAESTGGSIVAPASFCGVVGICPTYGLVSRYGLMDYANSLDKIGSMGKTVSDAALLLEVISGYDARDSTSVKRDPVPYSDFVKKDVREMTIGVLKEGFGKGVDVDIITHVEEGITKLKDAGVKVIDVSLPFTQKYGVSAYYLLALCEASTNLSRYCGLRYGASEKLDGMFNEYFTHVRSKHLGREAKRRIILGTFARMAGYRDAFYIKAAQVRTKIIEEYKQVFKQVDAIVCPTMPVLPLLIDQIHKLTPLQNYMMDILTAGPNLAGLPHMSVPVGTMNGLPIGMMLIGDHFNEEKIIQLGSWLE